VSDEVLLEALRTRRADAKTLLFARFTRDVNRLIWRLLGADPEHDDLVQHVFCQMFDHADAVREAEKLASWVSSITVNAVRSELRKRRVRRLFLARESVQPERFEDSVASSESRELLARVYTELENMPVADRMAYSLRYLENKSLSEVAELCGCSLATAKRRISRAHERLAPLRLSNHGDDSKIEGTP
jgi:RNA polymerase sigma-70 factor (ECF subfamily)